jgi:PAS domain S-box-containing protein
MVEGSKNHPPVFIVDDDDDMVLLIRVRLKKLGVVVFTAHDRSSALETLDTIGPGSILLLLDHMLPDGTGLEVMTEILQRRPEVATVVMSSSDDAKSVVGYMKAGARDYLIKGEGFVDMLGPVVQKTLDSMERIQKLKEAELSIKLHENLLSRSQAMAGMGSWRRNLDTRVSIWSSNLYEILEVSPEDVTDPREDWFKERVHPDDLPKILVSWDKTLREGKPNTVEYRFNAASGEKIIRAIHDSDTGEGVNPTFLFGTLRDVSEEKKSAFELHRLSMAVEQSSAAIIITNIQGKIEYVNERFCKVTGYTREEVIGENPRILKSEEHPESYYEAMWGTLLAGKDWKGEICNKTKKGKLIWESTQISCIKNERGETINFLSIREDVTEKKQFQNTMVRLNKALITANKETERLNAGFELFVPKQFLQLMKVEGAGTIKSGFSQEQTMTMLFADIRSFTQLSEGLGSERTFEFLNEYLRRIEPCIQENGGFVDKFVGDGIVALFEGESSAHNAVEAAVSMQREVKLFNTERPDVTDIVLGIGLHRGDVIIGALGSRNRLDSTVIGDSVNLAARVEELTKRFRAQILITDTVMECLEGDQHLIRKVMSLKVRGKHEVTQIFEIFDQDQNAGLKKASQSLLEEGINLYESHEFDKAHGVFDQVQRQNPSDILAIDYAVRSRYLRKFPAKDLLHLDFLEDLNHYLNHSADRRDLRHDVDFGGSLTWVDTGLSQDNVRLTNLSVSGIRIERCSVPLLIGSLVKFQFDLRDAELFLSQDIEAVCQVVWQKEDDEGTYGLQFVWMNRDHENAIVCLLEQISGSSVNVDKGISSLPLLD